MNAMVTKEKVSEGQGMNYPGALSIRNTRPLAGGPLFSRTHLSAFFLFFLLCLVWRLFGSAIPSY